MGDRNAVVGEDRKDKQNMSAGHYGLGHRNERRKTFAVLHT